MRFEGKDHLSDLYVYLEMLIYGMLVKKGHLTRSEEGSLLLVNDSGQTFKINEAVATIWRRCDGKTRQELSMEIAKERNSNFEIVDEKMAIIMGQLIKADLAEEVKKGGGLDDHSGMDLLEEISLPTLPIPSQIPKSNLDESRGIGDKKMIKALRDIQHRLKRIEDKIDNLDGLEIKVGDKLVFMEENGKIVVKKG